MFRSTFDTSGVFRLCCCAAVMAACLGVSGCANLDLRGERFQHDPMQEWAGTVRPRDREAHPFAVTNKGLQIERNFGIQ